MNGIPYLRLDRIKTDPQLMRLLPPEVALHYHALPVATDGSRITIAMASPEDLAASAAVSSAINAPICLVQADPKEIDQRLAEIWLQNPTPRLRLLLWSPTMTAAVRLQPYAQALAKLLDADLEQADFPWQGVQSFAELNHAADQVRADLIISQAPSSSLLKQVLLDSATQKLIDRLPASVIIAHNPRWPLAKILLALPDGDAANDPAIDWAVQLARSSHARVTVLPLLMYGTFIQHSLQVLLEANDPMGQKMRGIARRFTEDEIKGAFKLRDGVPQDQLRQEILASDPDLVIIAAEPQDCLWCWIAGELVSPLLAWANRPVLISKNVGRTRFLERKHR
ncbi:MAG: hypothetical protein ISS57_07705 [Anaerolineales bacterium]|nr:hypothetical protein [Chloroflexota bacterium]MBL7162476.1 hypothetical protein [Anaerolineales bacterium]